MRILYGMNSTVRINIYLAAPVVMAVIASILFIRVPNASSQVNSYDRMLGCFAGAIETRENARIRAYDNFTREVRYLFEERKRAWSRAMREYDTYDRERGFRNARDRYERDYDDAEDQYEDAVDYANREYSHATNRCRDQYYY